MTTSTATLLIASSFFHNSSEVAIFSIAPDTPCSSSWQIWSDEWTTRSSLESWSDCLVVCFFYYFFVILLLLRTQFTAKSQFLESLPNLLVRWLHCCCLWGLCENAIRLFLGRNVSRCYDSDSYAFTKLEPWTPPRHPDNKRLLLFRQMLHKPYADKIIKILRFERINQLGGDTI